MIRRVLCLAAASGVAISAAFAQTAAEREGGRRLTAGLSQRLELARNPELRAGDDEAVVAGVTGLSFGLSSVTRTQSLEAGAATRFRATTGESDINGLENARANLGYSLQGARGRFAVTAQYRRDEISFLDPLDDVVLLDDGTIELPEDIEDLTGRGVRQIYDLGLELATGQGGPVEFRLGLAANALRYSDVTSAGLNDLTSAQARAETRFALGAGRTLVTGLSHSESSRDPDVENTTTGIDIALRTALSEIEDYALTFGVTRTDVGTRYALSAGTNRQLRETTRLGFSLGAIRAADGEAVLSGALRLNQDLPRGQVSIALNRSVNDDVEDGATVVTALRTNYSRQVSRVSDLTLGALVTERRALTDQGEDSRTVALRAGYTQALTPLVNMSLNLSYVDRRDLDTDETFNSAQVSASLSRRLTEDWSLDMGISAQLRDDEGAAGQRRSETVFLSLGRSFNTSF